MQKPSQQFVEKLEKKLRLVYRAQHQEHVKAKRNWLSVGAMNFSKFFIPALSGALVLVLIIWNLKGGIFTIPSNQPQNDIQSNGNSTDERFATLSETAKEDQISQDFDNDELNQIDNSVKFVAQSNF